MTLERLLAAQLRLIEAEGAAAALARPALVEYNDAIATHAAHIGCPHVTVGIVASAVSAPGCNVLGGDYTNWRCDGNDG